ncbi:hypothetical protein [Lederbergia galactosidilytica]|nr:hypothetical protein [Lederbergia galactosidilytica]MBP1914758.1 hypothetical protein [Lederbergia galactosidilytica]
MKLTRKTTILDIFLFVFQLFIYHIKISHESYKSFDKGRLE